MAQADYVISPNPTGLAMRQEVNGIFQAILTNNAGSTAPAVTSAGMLWGDISNASTYYLKIRNHTNDGWNDLYAYDVATKTIAASTSLTLKGLTATITELNVLDGITVTVAELNKIDGVTSNIQTQFGTKAPLASPAFTGTPTAPTPTAGDNSTKIATTEFVFANASGIQAPTSYYDQSALIAGSQITLNIPNIMAYVNTTFVNIASVGIDINATTYWDNSTYATASNRAGKDFYIYALSNGTIKLSINSTYPTGSDANNSRKIGGFHTLCNSVGTISGHTLTGYTTGMILPMSVWDLFNRSSAGNEGMVKNFTGEWVDIYLPSWNGTRLVSTYGGTIADGVSSPAFHCYKFEQMFGVIGKTPVSQEEFVIATLGSNQGTNVTGSNDKGVTGGWTDTAGRRMISNIGLEDGCGLMWQWCRDKGGYTSGSVWANAYDGNDSGVAGQHYGAPYRGMLGGDWSRASVCGSRGSSWDVSPLALDSNKSSRGRAEPAKNKFV